MTTRVHHCHNNHCHDHTAVNQHPMRDGTSGGLIRNPHRPGAVNQHPMRDGTSGGLIRNPHLPAAALYTGLCLAQLKAHNPNAGVTCSKAAIADNDLINYRNP
ncbi:hypothetical protein ACIRPT_02685 [Streptomyces sp. NPDC101227]|uniref:hypothetical protein n=1 Tax=Streptomyces sp. NPDC101227 TaxID=3366136 RepID=UPI00382317E9